MKSLKSLQVPVKGHFKKSRFSQSSNQPQLMESNSPLPVIEKDRERCQSEGKSEPQSPYTPLLKQLQNLQHQEQQVKSAVNPRILAIIQQEQTDKDAFQMKERKVKTSQSKQSTNSPNSNDMQKKYTWDSLTSENQKSYSDIIDGENLIQTGQNVKIIGGTKLTKEYAIKLNQNKNCLPTRQTETKLISNPKDRFLMNRKNLSKLKSCEIYDEFPLLGDDHDSKFNQEQYIIINARDQIRQNLPSISVGNFAGVSNSNFREPSIKQEDSINQ
ncbi:UNKNOWN [Stylonychia lemnae]|uniref:Uncharacterized protein n=1 Tax=Stylonychia lemnae TaxID=5949 RepID=A0A078B748_STYLE|nr:UNKNOWN [Stylonychia lemnae]|eukprot:CDW90340.1 UNKNOWN [Stylonychia lemnae]